MMRGWRRFRIISAHPIRSAPIRPRGLWLVGIHHGRHGTRSPACDSGFFKDNILFNCLGRMGATKLGFRIAGHPRSMAVSGGRGLRALGVSVALAASVALAGCNSDEISLGNNANANP